MPANQCAFMYTGAGRVWDEDATCSALANTCQEYVANNPEAFVDAYWLFNYINVYTTGDSGSATPTGSGASPSATGAGGYRRFRA